MAEPDEGSTNKADSESEDECEVLEESPCGRWQKRREEVKLVDKKHTHISHTHTQKQLPFIKCRIDILKLNKSHGVVQLLKTFIMSVKIFFIFMQTTHL